MPASPKWVPASPGLVETPDSGEYNFGDTQTYTQKYNGKYADCVASALPKGTVGSGDTAGYIVQSCKVTKASGLRGLIVIVWEGFGGGSGVLPEDQFGLDPQDLQPATEKNAAFNSVTSEQFEWIKAAVFSSDDASAAAAREKIVALGSGDAAYKLHALLKRGVTNFYKPYFTYYWIQHFTSEPSFNTGAEIEAPGGPLSTTIASLSLTCLREADKLDYEGGIWRRTRRWKCTTDAFWEAVLYP